MTNKNLILDYHITIPAEYEGLLFKGISDYALEKKGLSPIQPFSIFIKDHNSHILGGIAGATFYGSMYIDSLWIDKSLRHQGWGTKLMQEAEKIGKEKKAVFATVHTMDWEGLAFYQKLGYSIEFIRKGYVKDSKMSMLRKAL